MPIFTRPTPSRPSTPLTHVSDKHFAPHIPSRSLTSSPSSSSFDLLSTPTFAPSSRLSTPTPLESWDTFTFSEKSDCLLHEHNGSWRTNFAQTIDTATTVYSSLSWHNLSETVSHATETASDTLCHRLNHAFQGRDLPAMHDRVMSLFPSVSMPSLRDVSRSFDNLTDSLADMRKPSRQGGFVDDYLVGDHFAFARHIGAKAKRALGQQGICQEWQVKYSRTGMEWQARLDEALVELYKEERKHFSVEDLFGMRTVWLEDVENRMWRLQLNTGMVEVVVGKEPDELEEKMVILQTGFGLPESYGCVKIDDVVIDETEEGEWMAVAA